jgi:hypothetical protein
VFRDQIRNQYFPNSIRNLYLYTSLFCWIRHNVNLQALRETAGNVRIADAPPEYKPDVVTLELMSRDSSVK